MLTTFFSVSAVARPFTHCAIVRASYSVDGVANKGDILLCGGNNRGRFVGRHGLNKTIMNSFRPTGARNLSLLLRDASPRVRKQFLRYSSSSSTSSVSADEISHFSSLASSWWDPQGPSRILHLMNPLRHDFIGSCLSEQSSHGSRSRSHLSDTETTASTEHATGSNASNSDRETGLSYLDIGCGGGIFAESLARTIPLSASSSAYTPTRASSILAIDPSTTLIKIASAHARKDPTLHSHLQSGRFRYENTSLEDLSSLSYSPPSIPSWTPTSNSPEPPKFDVVTLFEVLEHIDPSTSSPSQFLQMCLHHVKPGGWLIGSTIARTVPSYFVNKVVAEAPWPLGVVPRGTHEWSKFVNVDEVKGWAENGLREEQSMKVSDGRLSPSRTEWKCIGVIYIPGIGWKMMSGAENHGNYFFAVRKGP